MSHARVSKSSFLRGLQCHKSLYLDRYHPQLRDPVDPSKQAIFQTGHQVGELARNLFPGGVLGVDGHPSRVQQSLARTKNLISQGHDVLYEPAFQHEGVVAYVDILIRDGERWRAYEVKSSGSVKDVNYHDAAIQYYILCGSGIDVSDIFIVHLNTSYVRQGDLDLGRLFTAVSVLEEAKALQSEIPDRLQEMRSVLADGKVPNIDIGPHCSDPYDCDFMGHCWAHVPELSVFNVARLNKTTKFELYSKGILRIEDIPAGLKMSATSNFHVEHHKTGEVAIDRLAIRAFTDPLEYPLHFLDFETINPAIPPFDGTKPYGKIPFQYSLHRVNAPGDEPMHSGFLAEAGADPRRPLVDSLLEDLPEAGDIVVYNQSFEQSVITQLAEQLPEKALELEPLVPRLRDLMIPFQKRHYYHPDMNGSYSIKNVLPALVPALSYGVRAISDGESAMQAYLALQEEQNANRVAAIRSDLWEYCKLDTLAMVTVLERLDAVSQVSDPAKLKETGEPK